MSIRACFRGRSLRERAVTPASDNRRAELQAALIRVAQLAAECGELAAKARDGKLSAAEMQGACFTISSLGGIGGTAFTPIINRPTPRHAQPVGVLHA